MDKYFYTWFLFIAIIFIKVGTFHAYLVDNNPYRHIETLDRDGKYQLEWLVDWKESRIIFNVTVKTKGYVGLGLSRKGKMSGADIVIGGVMPNGQPYFSDRHAIGNEIPVEDASQDWDLHAVRESSTHTFLSFSRPFETCDEDHDLPINGDGITLIWAFGEKDDEVEYHYQNRGTFYTYLLDPDLTPRELEKTEKSGFVGKGATNGDNVLGNWKVWRILEQEALSTQDTAYICSIHKAPPGNRKRHIVGFRSILPTELERRHIHHYQFLRCTPPAGSDASEVFDHLIGVKQEGYILRTPYGPIPTQYCAEPVHVWAVGQTPIFFPDHLGIPMYENEYYLFQVHYDNPESIPGIKLSHTLEVFYTDNLRKHDAGVILAGSLTPGSPSVMLPPNSLAHQIYGHCASGCTKSMLPDTGIRMFGVFLHTHLAGRGIRFLHLRDGKELPWIAYDNNYNFDYQPIRILREERVVLPGDSLINHCFYENTDRGGNVTSGGFQTRQEMCNIYFWYYNKLPNRSWCRSEIRSDDYRRFFQIYNTTWDQSRRENMVTAPPANAGLLVSQVANRMDWTLARRKQLQDFHRYLPQVSMCPPDTVQEENNSGRATSRGSWFDGELRRATSPQPPLLPQRFGSKTRMITTRTSTQSSPSSPLTRPSSRQRNNNMLRGQDDYSSEILNPETEFLSVYPRDIVPYELPSTCLSANRIQ